jgi:ABC-type Co2+ transport system permease subunit
MGREAPRRVKLLALRGSPWFFVGWQLSLCAVAVTAALLRGADARRKRRLIRVLVAAAAVAALMYAPTVTGGWEHPVVTHIAQTS